MITIEFEVSCSRRLLRFTIITCIFDGSAPRAVAASPSSAFLVSPLSSLPQTQQEWRERW